MPTFDAFGQFGSAALPQPNCASEHAWSPSAADALTTVPAGRVTTAVFRSGVASELSVFGDWGTCRSTSSPVGESAVVVSGWTVSDGLNVSLLQPVTPTVFPPESALV